MEPEGVEQYGQTLLIPREDIPREDILSFFTCNPNNYEKKIQKNDNID